MNAAVFATSRDLQRVSPDKLGDNDPTKHRLRLLRQLLAAREVVHRIEREMAGVAGAPHLTEVFAPPVRAKTPY